MAHLKTYAVCCAKLNDAAMLAAVLPRLDATRRARVTRLQHPQKKAQCAAAGLLLSHLFGQENQPPQLNHNSRGKPYLADNRAFFSLSHSDDWVVCAIADSEVGVDVQAHCAYNENVANRYFTPTEKAWLAADPDGRFSRLWTFKEAYAKFTGFGLVLPPSSYTVPTPPSGWDDTNHCFWHEYTITDNDPPLYITVCCAQSASISPLIILDINAL